MISSVISLVKHNNRVASNNDLILLFFSLTILSPSREHQQNNIDVIILPFTFLFLGYVCDMFVLLI